MNNIVSNTSKTNEGSTEDPLNEVGGGVVETKEKEMKDHFSIKRQIIPEEWKEDIDEIIANELVGANRYFASTNKDMIQLITKEATQDPVTFLRNLHERWDWHNYFFENLLEPSIEQLLPKSALELSPSQVETIMEVYSVLTLVDQSTLVLSAGIKKCVENNLERHSQATDEEKSMMISSPNESYWITYRIEHLDYVASRLDNDSSWKEKEEKLLMKHHIGDRKIFNSRMKEFAPNFERHAIDIRKEIQKLAISNEYKIEHASMAKRRPRVKAMSDLLDFDNIEEYKIMRNLIGISGFIFRKKVIGYLKETKMVEGEVGIYELSDDKVIELLSKLKNYRSEFFMKDVLHYGQTGDTCGACSLMMAEKYFFDAPNLEKKNEDLIHDRSKSQFIEGDVFSLLATEAVELGLKTKLVHSDKDYFNNTSRYINQSLFTKLMDEYLTGVEKGVKKGLTSEVGVNINSKLLEKYLSDGYLVILAVMHGNYLHSILLAGHGNGKFMVHDPLRQKETFIDKRTIERISKTPIGSWLIAVKKDDKNLQKLLGKLPEFRDKALEYLDSSRLTGAGTEK